MKANEAPDKIYLSKDYKTNDVDERWFDYKSSDDDIEYVRTDVFIEKACEYFAPHIKDNSGGYDRAFVLEGFKKYMGG
jgi:hypothetical protein